MGDTISFTITRDAETEVLIASWDDPITGGITTQANSVEELVPSIREAVLCHFDANEMPKQVMLHFVEDPALVLA